MTRLDATREAAGKTRDALAPYAVTAKDSAAHYADEARQRLAPRIEALTPRMEAAAAQARSTARNAARSTYDQHLAPRVEQARAGLPPQVEEAALRAAQRTRQGVLTAKEAAVLAALQTRATAGPPVSHLVEEARTAASPVAQEAQMRAAAALTALRGQVTAADIERLVRKRARRERRGCWAQRMLVLGLLAGGGVAAWKWWRKQSSPEWLVEPPAERTAPMSATPSGQVRAVSPTGIAAAEAATQDSVDGSLPMDADAQAEEDGRDRKDRDGRGNL